MKKLIYLLSVCFLFSNYTFSQTEKISGVITYYFNKYQGDKADIGAEVFIIDSTKVLDFNKSAVDSFHYASSYKSMINQYKSIGVKPDSSIAKSAKNYDVENEEHFNHMDKMAFRNLLKIQYHDEVIKTVVDGVGNYSVNVSPGTYYVYIKSHNRSGRGMTEVSGCMYFKKVKIKKGQNVSISNNFRIVY